MTGLAPFRCAACRRETPEGLRLVEVMSVLDWRARPLCPGCVDNRAEPLDAITAIIRMDRPRSWAAVSPIVRRSIRVYDGGDYVTVKDWAERMTRRQLVLVQSEKDREDAEILKKITRRMREMRPPQPPPSWRSRLASFAASFFRIERTAT